MITALWGWIPASAVAVGMIVVWGLLRLFRYINIRQLRLAFLGLLWVAGIGAGILPIIENAGFKEKKIEFISLAVAFLIPAIWETINHANRSKK